MEGEREVKESERGSEKEAGMTEAGKERGSRRRMKEAKEEVIGKESKKKKPEGRKAELQHLDANLSLLI